MEKDKANTTAPPRDNNLNHAYIFLQAIILLHHLSLNVLMGGTSYLALCTSKLELLVNIFRLRPTPWARSLVLSSSTITIRSVYFGVI